MLAVLAFSLRNASCLGSRCRCRRGRVGCGSWSVCWSDVVRYEAVCCSYGLCYCYGVRIHVIIQLWFVWLYRVCISTTGILHSNL